jgi:hypothetical protein
MLGFEFDQQQLAVEVLGYACNPGSIAVFQCSLPVRMTPYAAASFFQERFRTGALLISRVSNATAGVLLVSFIRKHVLCLSGSRRYS